MIQSIPVSPVAEQFPQSALGETRYLFERWQLSIASDGRCWATPVRAWTTPEEVAAFLALFQPCWDDLFPAAMIFNFSGVKVLGEQWSLLLDLLHDFASSHRAKSRVFCFRCRPGKIVVISRAARTRPA
ncbi:MAG TPA: hypothetical protein VNT79_06950 [Phycisphaerae bacterium]|nr:hypothetical protein [Phycisphaerae bacterium]